MTDLVNFGWVVPGRLAGMGRPHPEAGRALRDAGIRSVLCLTEEPPPAELSRAGIHVRHEPVADFTAPDAERLSRCVDFVRERMARGDAVAVHCHAGYGRTGTVMAACLVASGLSPEAAIARVRALRPGSVETPEQEGAVRAFAASRRAGGGGNPGPVLRVALSGAYGRMGRVIGPGLEAAPGIALVARITRGDDLAGLARAAKANVVVDFSTPQAAAGNARAILEAGACGVVGTTGFSPRDLDELDALARERGLGLVVAPNFAVGAVLARRFAREAARFLPRAEVVEGHHEGKRDAPSGTALDTARVLAEAGAGRAPDAAGGSRGEDVDGVRVHSVRLPGLLAHQETWLSGPGEVLTIRHDATSRECYLPGVLLAVRAVPGRVGLVRGLEPLLDAAGRADAPA